MTKMFFLSYSSKDRSRAREIKDKIENETSFPIWMDESELHTGDAWKQLIDNGIESSLAVILLVSKASCKSNYVTYEWSYAMGCGKRIIPLYLEPANTLKEIIDDDERDLVHPKIHPNERQFSDFSDPSNLQWDKLFDELRDVVEEDFVSPQLIQLQLEATSSDPQRRTAAFEFLKTHADKTHAEDILVELCKNQQPQVAGQAGLALVQRTQYSDARAVQGLRQGFLFPENNSRNVYLDALSNMYTCSEAADTLLFLWKQDNSYQDEVERALNVLTRGMKDVDSNVSLSLKNAFLYIINQNDVREPESYLSIGKLEIKEAIPFLMKQMQREDISSSELNKIVSALGSLRAKEALSILYEKYKTSREDRRNSKSLRILTSIVEATLKIGGDETLEMLKTFSKDGLIIQQTELHNHVMAKINELESSR